MNLYETILVAIDLTPYSEETLKKAKVLADRLGSTLHLIHIVEPLPISAYHFMGGLDGIENQMLEEARHKVLRQGMQFGIPETQQYVELGTAKHGILEKADEIKVDLIVIGSHSKKSMAHLLGSTASSVVNSASRDVIVIYTNQ